jgi:hypothetical protein
MAFKMQNEMVKQFKSQEFDAKVKPICTVSYQNQVA